ncbi:MULTISPECIES: hypothetical protein [Hyphobacterium]|uniref:Lipoprotein n=1 Tax=Hyphobacterium vulgare TaxID=1736751 RepID=A0ABV6ZVX1_9PROT
MKRVSIIAALALTACATTAEQSTSAYQAAREEGRVTGINEDGERVRCERIRETGSRFTERVCRTEREWELIEENARQASTDSQNRWPRDCGPLPDRALPQGC